MLTFYDVYQQSMLFAIFSFTLLLWILFWQGVALWYAGKHRQKWWFIALFLIQTGGILPIIYLFWFRPRPVIFPQHTVVRTHQRRR